MKVKELIKCLQVDEQTDEPIDPECEVEIILGLVDMDECSLLPSEVPILSIYNSGNILFIDVGED